MKYSIIVPVYNVEAYINRCLASIKKQTYNNFEVIVVNDGTQDDSMSIIKKFVDQDNRFQVYTKENGGLSDARNYGVKQATGDIILFIDGDDYIEKDLLSKLTEEFEKNRDIEVVRLQLKLVNDNGEVIEQPRYHVFSNLDSSKAYPLLLKNVYVDVAWGYAYRKDFFINNKFEYAKGKINEDFGLTHLILIKANHISSISYVGYNYVQRDGSIMNIKNRGQNLRKVYDTLFHFDNYITILKNDSSISSTNKELLLKYIISVIIYRSALLEGNDLKQYIKELKKRKIYQYFPNQTFKDKLRKLFIQFNTKAYISKNVNK